MELPFSLHIHTHIHREKTHTHTHIHTCTHNIVPLNAWIFNKYIWSSYINYAEFIYKNLKGILDALDKLVYENKWQTFYHQYDFYHQLQLRKSLLLGTNIISNPHSKSLMTNYYPLLSR